MELGVTRQSAAEIGAPTFGGPLPVAALAQLRYQPFRRSEPISAGTAVLRLFGNTVCPRSRATEALDALMAAANGIRAVAGNRGEAVSAVPAIRALVST